MLHVGSVHYLIGFSDWGQQNYLDERMENRNQERVGIKIKELRNLNNLYIRYKHQKH